MRVDRTPLYGDSEEKLSSFEGGFGVAQNPRQHEDNGKNF